MVEPHLLSMEIEAMIVAERTDSVPIGTVLTKYDLFVTGATVEASIFDPVNGTWLVQGTGLWQPTRARFVLPENPEQPGHYIALADMTNSDIGTTHFETIIEVTAGGSGAESFPIVVVNELYDAANATDQSAILVDTSTTLPAAIGATDAKVDVLGTDIAALQSDVDGLETTTGAILTDTSATIPALIAPLATLTAVEALPSDAEVASAVWAEDLGVGTASALQEQAALGGAGVTPLQIQQSVWGALQEAYTDAGTMGRAIADSADLPAELVAAMNRFYQAVRRYGPILIKQPIASKDEVHAGDVGIIITLPVILDGNYSDLSDATSITFDILSPSGTMQQMDGMGVTTSTGSYTTFTSTAQHFDSTGRWVVQVTVTWPDLTTKQSLKYPVDVVAALAA